MKNLMICSAVVLGGLAMTGCDKAVDKNAAPAHAAPAAQIAANAESHEGWWCDEHGVPESVCAQCSTTLAADFKAKGDWCKEHDRPESQCFVCHPDLVAKFAAQYAAKYGKEPPKPN